MGMYDLPAVIDYILKVTGQKDIIYIGHSLGTTMMFVMSSMRPEYVYKVKFMVGLAPAAFFRRRIMFPRVMRFVRVNEGLILCHSKILITSKIL